MEVLITVAHSQTANGGLMHAKAKKALRHGTGSVTAFATARQAAFGRGVILSADGKVETATAPKASMPKAHAYNRKGDVRCPNPACRHVNKSVRTSPHICESCQTKFEVTFQ